MTLNEVWDHFLHELQCKDFIVSCYRKDITGIPFLYLQVKGNADCTEYLPMIEKSAKKAMYKKKVTSKTTVVRKHGDICVYRHRFYVPQEKMFCCGNFCEDCILKRNNSN